MKERTLRVLEYNKIKEKVKKYTVTSAAKEIIDNLTPYNNPYEVREKLKETDEALDILVTKGAPPFEGLYDVREALERSLKGGVLSPTQILRVGNMLRASRRFKGFMARQDEEKSYPKLEDLAYILEPNNRLEDKIENAIVSEEEVSDKASDTLRGIRRSLKEKNSSVRDKINSIVRENSKYLQDAIYTMRGERYVLPVRAEYKGQVQGIVHDQSSTGATVFIEPISLVKLNNEIKELMLKEKAEIERILTELSNEISLCYDICSSNFKILMELDFIFAKGKYASSINAILPEVNEEGSFSLLSARHPLIDPKVVVPSDIYLGEQFTTLMITGPNTGGKTVTLKTVGLLHLMALSGFMIPAKSGSSVCFFEGVYADIGDEQSIEQSLSTFSSHMTNIVNILESAKGKSLVLFDEIGSGTDPSEGSALAVAILESLRKKGNRVIATTHYSELKAYAIKTDEIENASVEFDVNTLRPTYRLLIGVPGKSNAFDISKRLGLSKDIIDSAREYMHSDNLQFEDLIRELGEKSSLANKEAREAKKLRIDAVNLKREYEEKLSKIETVRDKAYEDARIKAKQIISEAKDEADDILKSMRALEKLGFAQGGRAKLEEERKKLKKSLEEKELSLMKQRENEGEPIKEVTLGMDAFLPSLNQNVIILSMPDAKGEVTVEAGIMKIKAKVKDLRAVKGKEKKKEKKRRELNLNLKHMESRIDLRGMDSEEACYRTDKYLDEAYLANLGEVTIVHGKGTGILRKAINDMLKRHPHVKSYRLGVYGEGGDGVTVVVLK